MIITKRNSREVWYGTILNGRPWTCELHIPKPPQATCLYSPACLFSKEKRKSGWRKSCCCKTERNKSKMENRKRKGFSIPTVITLIYPHHIQNKPVCKQQAIQSQTTTNCNPEMSIRTCIHMVEKRPNGVWLFQLTTASQCLQKDLMNTL